MEKAKTFLKTLKILNNNAELSLQIEVKESLFIRVKHSINPLIQWTYSKNYEQITKEFPRLLACESLLEIAELLIDLIGNNEYSIEEIDTGLVLIIDFKLFKTKLKFNLAMNEIKDPNAILVEMSNLIMKLSANSPKPLYQGSDIIQEDDVETIRKWIDPQKKIKLTLLYKGKDDGFLASEFHKKCDGKAQTLTVAKSHLDSRFGGFTTVPWDSTGAYKKDANAFLFSLTNNLKLKENGAGTNSVYCHPNYGPTFGGGHDLYFAEKCSGNFTSYSSLGNNYSKEGIGNVHFQNVLAGSYNFFVKFLEVYQVRYI